MVGSVLLQRMREEGDFEGIEARFFSTSQVGQPGPDVGSGSAPLGDANDPEQLGDLDAIVSCQGGDYTGAVHPRLRKSGYRGYWIDAASTLRLSEDAVIVLGVIVGRLTWMGSDWMRPLISVSRCIVTVNPPINAVESTSCCSTTYRVSPGIHTSGGIITRAVSPSVPRRIEFLRSESAMLPVA
jgi:aspartate-semialdehyde dehydrogenase